MFLRDSKDLIMVELLGSLDLGKMKIGDAIFKSRIFL